MTTVKQRSPNYPGHDLAQAIEDVKRLYGREHSSLFPLEAAAKAIGFGTLNGAARVRIATMRQYGLLVQPKGKEAKLTDRAITLVLRNPASREYKQAMREAALEPPLFHELAETRLQSSDESLKHYLVVSQKFTDDGASKFITAFRNSMSLAGVAGHDTMAGQNGHEEAFDEDDDSMTTTSTPMKPQTQREAQRISEQHKRIPMKLADGKEAAIELPETMTDAAWRHMLRLLGVMKDGYVRDESSTPMSTPTEPATLLSDEAEALLERIDNGGVPMSMTAGLQCIAEQHGIEVKGDTKPNDVIDQLKAMR